MYLMAGSELASKFNLSDLHKDVCKHTVLLIMSKNMLTVVCMAEVGSFLGSEAACTLACIACSAPVSLWWEKGGARCKS